MTYYRQCTFRQDSAVTTAWIEECGAKVGKILTFEDEGSPDGHWTVEEVGETRLKEEYVRDHERAYMKHRKFSDI